MVPRDGEPTVIATADAALTDAGASREGLHGVYCRTVHWRGLRRERAIHVPRRPSAWRVRFGSRLLAQVRRVQLVLRFDELRSSSLKSAPVCAHTSSSLLSRRAASACV